MSVHFPFLIVIMLINATTLQFSVARHTAYAVRHDFRLIFKESSQFSS